MSTISSKIKAGTLPTNADINTIAVNMKELCKHNTFGLICCEINSEKRTFSSRVWLVEMLKTNVKELIAAFVQSKSKQIGEFYKLYIKKKFKDSEYTGYDFTQSFIASLASHKVAHYEIYVADRMLSVTEVSKDILIKIEKCNKWIYVQKGMFTPRHINSSKVWLNYKEIMMICKDVYSDKNMSNEIIESIQNEAEVNEETSKTDPELAELENNLITGSLLNLCYFQKKLLDIFVRIEFKKKETLVKKNEKTSELRVKLSKIHGQSMATEIDYYEEDNKRFNASTDDPVYHIKDAIATNLGNLKEQKRSYVTEIQKLHRNMNKARGNIVKITALISALDAKNAVVRETVETTREILHLGVQCTPTKVQSKVMSTIGYEGVCFLEGGSKLRENLLENWIKKIKYSNIDSNTKDTLVAGSQNFAIRMQSHLKDEFQSIENDKTLYPRIVKVKIDQEIGYKENYEKMQYDMKPLECSDYDACSGTEGDSISKYNDSRFCSDFEYNNEDDEEDDDLYNEEHDALLYVEDAYKKFNSLLGNMKTFWADQKKQDKQLSKSILKPSRDRLNRPAPIHVNKAKSLTQSKLTELSPTKTDFSPLSPFRNQTYENRDIDEDDAKLIAREHKQEQELMSPGGRKTTLHSPKLRAHGTDPLAANKGLDLGASTVPQQPELKPIVTDKGMQEDAEQPKAEPETKLEDPVVVPDEKKPEDPVVVPDEKKAEDPVVVPEEKKAEDPIVVPDEKKPEDPVVVPDEEKAADPVVVPDENKAEDPVVVPDENKAEDPVVVPEASPEKKLDAEQPEPTETAQGQQPEPKETTEGKQPEQEDGITKPIDDQNKTDEKESPEHHEADLDDIADQYLAGDPDEHMDQNIEENDEEDRTTFNEDELPDIDGWENWGENLTEKLAQNSVRWSGTEKYDGELGEFHVVYENMQVGFDMKIFGHDEDSLGEFTMVGEISKDSTIEFHKVYSKEFYISYKGKMDGTVWKGTLEVTNKDDAFIETVKDGTKGFFEITPDRSEFTGFMNIDEGEDLELKISLKINEQGVFGMGKDDNGNYIIRGKYDRKARDVRFAIVYVEDGRSMQFVADGDEIGDDFKIKGIWQMHEDSKEELLFGVFELTGELWPGPIWTEKKDWWNWGSDETGLKRAIWDGWFVSPEDGHKYWREFHNLQVKFDDFLIFGSGEDFYGKFNIAGTSYMKDHKWKMEFKMEYEDTSKFKDPTDASIRYNCIFEDDKLKGFAGNTVDTTADIEMNIWISPCVFLYCDVDDATRSHEPFTNENNWEKTSFNIGFSTKGIFGIGNDPGLGYYIIRGNLDTENMSANFAKQYILNSFHTTTYVGRFNIHENDIIIKGVWEAVRDENKGFFKIQGKFGDQRINPIADKALMPFIPINERSSPSPRK